VRIATVLFVALSWLSLAATVLVAATYPRWEPAEQPIVYIERVGACWRGA